LALPLVTFACALVVVGGRLPIAVVIRLSWNSHVSFSLHVKRHVVSSGNNVPGFSHRVSSCSQQLLCFRCCLSPSLLQWWLQKKREAPQIVGHLSSLDLAGGLFGVNLQCCTLLHAVARCCTLLHAAARCCTLLHVAARCCTLLRPLHAVARCTRCCTLLHAAARCCTLLHAAAR
jgi:hypothetical protein